MLPSVETLARLVAELGLSFDNVARGEVAETEEQVRPQTQLEQLIPCLSKRALRAMTSLAFELRDARVTARSTEANDDE